MPSAFPTYDSVYNLIKDIDIPFSPKLPNIPLFGIPSIPVPIYANLCIPDFEKSLLATEMLGFQFMNWILAAFNPIISFLGIAFEFPKVPYLNISLLDLVNPNFDLAALIPTLPNFSAPMLPNPVLPHMVVPQVELLAKAQALIQNYMGTLIQSITGLIQLVVNKLGKNPFNFVIAMPIIPALPTDFNSLMSYVYTLIGVPNLESLISKLKIPDVNFSIENIMSSISIPAFLDLNLSVRDPIFGKFNNPQMKIMQMSKNLHMAMGNAALSIIKKFCDAVSRFISFSFPTMCIPVPTISR
jgi:hypothetical protein